MKRWLLVGLMLVAAQAMALMYEWRDTQTGKLKSGNFPPKDGTPYWQEGTRQPGEYKAPSVDELRAQQKQELKENEARRKEKCVGGPRGDGIRIGMTEKDFVFCYRHPEKINRTQYANEIREQWVFRGPDEYFYFVNGILVSFQD